MKQWIYNLNSSPRYHNFLAAEGGGDIRKVHVHPELDRVDCSTAPCGEITNVQILIHGRRAIRTDQQIPELDDWCARRRGYSTSCSVCNVSIS